MFVEREKLNFISYFLVLAIWIACDLQYLSISRAVGWQQSQLQLSIKYYMHNEV